MLKLQLASASASAGESQCSADQGVRAPAEIHLASEDCGHGRHQRPASNDDSGRILFAPVRVRSCCDAAILTRSVPPMFLTISDSLTHHVVSVEQRPARDPCLHLHLHWAACA